MGVLGLNRNGVLLTPESGVEDTDAPPWALSKSVVRTGGRAGAGRARTWE